MIELTHGSFVKQFPAIFAGRLKFATATLAFLLLTFLLAGSTDQVQKTALPVLEEAIPVYSSAPDEEIDYDELLNRIPLRKSAPKPSWMDWTSRKKRLWDFG